MDGHTSRYGSLFWASVAVGGAAMGFGVWTAVVRAGAVHPFELAAFVIGLLLVHDLLVAPLTLLAATVMLRRAPRVARGAVAGAIAATVVLTVFALPVVFRWGAQVDNPSVLPRNGVAGLAVVLAGVWIVAAVGVLRRLRGGR